MEYYLMRKRNELWNHKKTQRQLNAHHPVKEDTVKKMTYVGFQPQDILKKVNYGVSKKTRGCVWEGGVNSRSTEDFQVSENTPYDTATGVYVSYIHPSPQDTQL